MNRGKNMHAEAIHALRTRCKLLNYSVDNYIEKELLGNLYKLVNHHLEGRIESFSKLVNEMPTRDSSYRKRVMDRITSEILNEVYYSKEVRTLNKTAIPETGDFSLILYWVKQSRRVVNETIPSYHATLKDTYQRIYNTTKNNRLKRDLIVQLRIMEDKFFVILNLLQKDFYGRYIQELENLYITCKTYLTCYDEVKLDSESVDLSLTNSIKNDFKTICDSRFLNKLALDNDFIKVGQSGSHAQFKHSDGRLVTIPQGRELGKGLSIKIQKDIGTDRLTRRLNLIGG